MFLVMLIAMNSYVECSRVFISTPPVSKNAKFSDFESFPCSKEEAIDVWFYTYDLDESGQIDMEEVSGGEGG